MTNYDQTDIPAAYDRARDHGPEALELWMDAVAAHMVGRSIQRILDLGCGTGRFSEGLAARFNADVIGLDPSAKMLQIARDKQRDARVHYQRGRAEAIPLASASVDLVFMSMSFHHFDDPLATARECRRVVRNDGTVVIRTGTRDQISSYAYVPFFAATRRMLEEILPSSTALDGTFAAAGFRLVAAEAITQTIAPDWNAYAEKLAAGGDSVLARLSREEFDDGLRAVRRHAEQVGPRPVVEPVDLFVFRPESSTDIPRVV